MWIFFLHLKQRTFEEKEKISKKDETIKGTDYVWWKKSKEKLWLKKVIGKQKL